MAQKLTSRLRSYATVGALVMTAIVVAGCGEAKKPAANSVIPAKLTRPDALPAETVRWLTSLDEAKKVATAEGKDLFINFTGLSWCGECIELERDVLTRPEFAPAAEQFVLVRLDFDPSVRRLPQEPPEPQVSWRDYYDVDSFPTVILADASGRPYGMTGNNGLRPAPYLAHVQELHQAHAKRDAAFAKAAAAEGPEKARYLADGLGALRAAMHHVSGSNADPLVRFYREEIATLIQLDPDSSAGLKPKYEETLRAEKQRSDVDAFYDRLDAIYKEQGVDAALQLLDEKIATTESPDLRNKFRQSRRTQLEWSDRHEEALALSRELAADETLSENERFDSRKRIAFNLWRLKRIDEAVALFDEMIAEAGDNPRRKFGLLWEKAQFIWYENRFTEVLAAWEAAIPLVEPNTEDWRNAQWWRIRTLTRMGRADEAWQAYETVNATGNLRPMERASFIATIAVMLNEHGSRDAALNAAAKAEQALAAVQIESKQDREGADRVRQMLSKVTARSEAAEPAGESVRWLTNLDEAKKVAAAEGKDLLIVFTGSSWCGPCKQLENEVLSRAEFAPTAEHFVLVKLDYPPGVRRLPQEPADSPVSWSDFYCGGGLPGVFLADTTGKPYATTGNMGLEARAFRDHIEKLRGVHGKRDEAFAKAAVADGIERAKYLADGLTTLRNAIEENYRDRNNDPLFRFYRAEIDEVLRLDADGAAGLRGPIDKMLAESNGEELNAFYALLDKTLSEQDIDAALKMLDDRFAETESAKLRNDLRLVRRNYLEQGNRFEEAFAVSRELARDESRTADERFTDRTRMAWNLWRLNRHQESLALYDELFASSARYPWRLFALARDQADSFQYSGRFAEALSTWERVIPRLEPRSDLLHVALLSRSRLLARLGRADDAWAEFDRVSAEGWWEPIEPVTAMVQIAEGLNEHGSRDAALAAAARAEKALNELVAKSKLETNSIDFLRLKLEKVKAGPPTKAAHSSDPPASEDSKK